MWLDIPSKYMENIYDTFGFTWRMFYWIIFFLELACLPFFAIFLLSASWVLFLKQKAVNCILIFWQICAMLISYMLMLF